MTRDVWGDLSESFGLAATPVALLEMLREFEGYSYHLGRHVEVSVEGDDIVVRANEERNRLDPWTGRPEKEVEPHTAARFTLTKSEQGIQVDARCPLPTTCGGFYEELVGEMKQRFGGDDAFVQPEETGVEMLRELLEGTKKALRATSHEFEESQEASERGAKDKREKPRVPKPGAHRRRWRAIWAQVQAQVEKGSPVKSMCDWLQKMYSETRPELVCSEDTLADIIRAGKAGLLTVGKVLQS